MYLLVFAVNPHWDDDPSMGILPVRHGLDSEVPEFLVHQSSETIQPPGLRGSVEQ